MPKVWVVEEEEYPLVNTEGHIRDGTVVPEEKLVEVVDP